LQITSGTKEQKKRETHRFSPELEGKSSAGTTRKENGNRQSRGGTMKPIICERRTVIGKSEGPDFREGGRGGTTDASGGAQNRTKFKDTEGG